jgi:hypothetical protein
LPRSILNVDCVREIAVMLDREVRQPGAESTAQLESPLPKAFLNLCHFTGRDEISWPAIRVEPERRLRIEA